MVNIRKRQLTELAIWFSGRAAAYLALTKQAQDLIPGTDKRGKKERKCSKR